MKSKVFKSIKILHIGGVMLATIAPTSQAETITIGKGSGVLWEGMPFNVNLSGPMYNDYLRPIFGIMAISSRDDRCMFEDELKTIAGVKALEIAPGVGLAPRATGTASYTFAYDGSVETLTGTIGLPETRGDVNVGVTITNPVEDRYWCLPPRMSVVDSFYDPSANRTATIAGTWVLVTDGSQKTSEVSVPPMWAGSFANVVAGDLRQSILPSTIRLRISTLECTANTPTAINFGPVQRDTGANIELASITNPLNIVCTQDSDRINANINVQFRALTGLYGSSPSKLSLKQGGGYITGAIDTVTGDGSCAANNGITFDNKQVKIGSIASTESSKAYVKTITWRLCSGGRSLPVGKVDAAAELLVTYN